MAQTDVRQIDADTLLVELNYGKPPHGRMLIERADDPAVFATFDAMRTQPKRNFFAGLFGSAPGKNHPPQIHGLDDASQETTEFAQFEETTDTGEVPAQQWHGAPGKGQPLR
ncbi:MAG: hypothetical protein RLZZ227_143 [Pseudomonadota bacterium]